MNFFLTIVKNKQIPSITETIYNLLNDFIIGMLLISIIILILWINLCCEMAQIAEYKGHKYFSYFFLCLFTGIFGFIVTMALKDFKKEQQNNTIIKQNNQIIKLLEENIKQNKVKN
jgi:uncharacterized membrane protein